MPPEESRPKRKLPILGLTLAGLVALVAAYLLLKGVDLVALGGRAMGILRTLGPWAFFAAAAVLPACGAPLTAFTVLAGEVFAPLMTLMGVIAAMILALVANLALTYWLARFALRPVLAKLAERYGYKVPRVTKANALSVTLVFRLTPGIPFFLQSYILGLAEIPFGLYMLVSSLCISPMAVGTIVLGKGIFNGNFRMVGIGTFVLLVATLLVHWLRKRYAPRVD
jgi:uncharacterized membrane protein YdjX (TVP38/TMEM64 family)